MRLEISYKKKHKHMEAKQYAAKTAVDHWGNKKLLRDKWKWKQEDPKPIGCSKSSSKREVYTYTILGNKKNLK